MDNWSYQPAPDLDLSLAEQLRGFPRQPRMWHFALRSAAAVALRGWMRTYHRLRIHGRAHLPLQQSFVMVCNHTSHLDTLSLLCALPIRRLHRVFPAAAADYFFSSLPRSMVSAVLINALPFERQTRGADSLAVCAALLETPGNVLILFPEGTRTQTGQMGRFRSGIGRLVVGTPLPVVPCHLAGGVRAWPKGAALPRPFRLSLAIGDPVSYGDRAASPEAVRGVCEDLEHRVRQLGVTGHDHL